MNPQGNKELQNEWHREWESDYNNLAKFLCMALTHTHSHTYYVIADSRYMQQSGDMKTLDF